MTHEQTYQQVVSHMNGADFASAKSLLDKHLRDHDTDEVAHSLYGTMLLRSGDNSAALDRFRQNATKFPGSFAAHADLAFTAKRIGELRQAKESFLKALELNANFYQGWVFLSQTAYALKDYNLAIEADAESEKYDPLDAEYPKMQAAMREGKHGEAENIARSMLQKQPGHPRAAYFLGHLASTVGAHEARADIMLHSLEHHPANQMLRRSRIEAFETIGCFEDALAEAKHLVEIAPNYFNYWTLSRLYGRFGDNKGALAAAKRASAYLEENSEEQGKLDLLRGHALKILGRRKESEAAYRACIQNMPGNGAGWWGLADLKNYTFGSDDVEAMTALLNNTELEADQRCQVAFALAKSHENSGDAVEAFSFYKIANDLRPDVNFHPEKHREVFERIKRTYGPRTLTVQADSEPDVTPIFILGMPRAGSTLIEQILASHSRIEGTMELLTLQIVERLIRVEQGRKHDVDYPESAARLTTEDCRKYGEKYLKDTKVFRTEKPYFIDKLPPNFERVGLIHKILPNAVIIDARRNPLDCCYSAYKQHFAGGHEYSYDLANLGAYYNDYLTLMDHWDEALPGKVIRVQYEEMVADTETEVKKLLDAMGLEFEEGCLKFYENKRAVRTASSEQVRQPINNKGLKVWQAVEDKLEPLKEALGADTLTRFEKYL